jgi:hypothetical protein
MAQSIPPQPGFQCAWEKYLCNVPTLEFLVYRYLKGYTQGNIYKTIKMPFNILPNYIYVI